MKNNNFIITLTGPSQSGKSLIADKIMGLQRLVNGNGLDFKPRKIKKCTTRRLRLDEMQQLDRGLDIDVEHVRSIPDECDLVYQSYGIRYGLNVMQLKESLNSGCSPVVILNDIRAVEEIRGEFPGQVLSLFLFRKIPEMEDYREEAKDRGNVSEQEIRARYEKAVAIYRIYIENISLFDHVILNAIEYDPLDLQSGNTILDMQLKSVIKSVLKGSKRLRTSRESEKNSKIFVIAGHAASGKDEIIRALISMGKLEATVIPKYTSRQQEPEDGREMVCKYIPKTDLLLQLHEEYHKQKMEIEKILIQVLENLNGKYQKEFAEFTYKLEESEQDEYQRFWEFVSSEIGKTGEEQVLKHYFQINPDYVDLEEIVGNTSPVFTAGNASIYNFDSRIYIIYKSDSRLYGSDVTEVGNILVKNERHLVMAASDIGVVECLKHLFEEEKVKFVYAHSDITASEFEANASDSTKRLKKNQFKTRLNHYTKNISSYDHVTIYAKAKLTYEQTEKEEELTDQMFRLLRFYRKS